MIATTSSGAKNGKGHSWTHYHAAVTTEEQQASYAQDIEPDCPANSVVKKGGSNTALGTHMNVSHLTACERFLTVR